jgi:transposase
MIAMGSPKAGNHNDLYEIEKILKEILTLLKETEIEYKILFFNADKKFDSKSLRTCLGSKEIITNIKPNPKNGEQPDVYFDEKLQKNRYKMIGLMDINT